MAQNAPAQIEQGRVLPEWSALSHRPLAWGLPYTAVCMLILVVIALGALLHQILVMLTLLAIVWGTSARMASRDEWTWEVLFLWLKIKSPLRAN